MSDTIRKALHSVVTFLEEAGFDYMVIGGFALPFYGMIRTTIDINIAVSIGSSILFDTFRGLAEETGFKHTFGSFKDPICIFVDRDTGLEIEFWTRPDGIEWDMETLARRQKHRLDDVEAWVISPEDFIVNKLARPDRGVQDERNVKSVLVRLRDALDEKYLERRAKNAGVWAILRVINEVS